MGRPPHVAVARGEACTSSDNVWGGLHRRPWCTRRPPAADLWWLRPSADLGRRISAAAPLLRARHGGPSLSSKHDTPSLSLMRRPLDPASNRPPTADLTTGGSGGVDPVTSSGGGANPATTERIQPPAAVGAWILPRAMAARGIGLGGLFLFHEIINRGGLLNSIASVNSINQEDCLEAPVLVNRLTEAVGPPVSVKAGLTVTFGQRRLECPPALSSFAHLS
jgi:hypothetical protein